jgi:hypothetical protein
MFEPSVKALLAKLPALHLNERKKNENLHAFLNGRFCLDIVAADTQKELHCVNRELKESYCQDTRVVITSEGFC